MTPVFLDTSYLIALEASDDQNHAKATDHWLQLKQRLPPLITSSFVLVEVATFFNSRGNHAKAVAIGERLRNSHRIQLVHVDPSLLWESWDYFRTHSDKRFSLTDCSSFILMSRHGVNTALTFDHHFQQAGYVNAPGVE